MWDLYRIGVSVSETSSSSTQRFTVDTVIVRPCFRIDIFAVRKPDPETR